MKFIIVTVFPNKYRTAIRAEDVLQVAEPDSRDDAVKLYVHDRRDGANLAIAHVAESFDNVMEQLRNVD